jgi:hypothetical protein
MLFVAERRLNLAQSFKAGITHQPTIPSSRQRRLRYSTVADATKAAILKLLAPDEWRKTIAYRNEWVHSKPPIIEGTGMEYERRNRLRVSPTHIGISVGGGDTPRYSVDDLLSFIRPALWLFTETTSTTVEYYIELLNKKHQPFWKEG